MIYDSLQNYVQLRQGFAINKATDSFVSNEQSQEFPYPLLRIADMINGKYAKYVSKKIHKSVIVNQNDLIYTRTGQIGLVFTGFEGVLHNNSFIVDVIDDKIDKQYLYTALQSSFVRQQALTLAKNSVQPDLTHDMFKKIIIPFPSKDIQYKIAGIIGAINKKIVLNNRVNATLEAMAKTLYDYWFVQFDFPDEKGRPYKTSGGKMVYNEELGREIPAGWEVGKIASFVKEAKNGDWGSEKSSKNHTYQVICLRGADFPSIAGGIVSEPPTRFIDPKHTDRILEDGDIIIEISGGSPTQSTGRACYINKEVLKRFDKNIVTSNFCKALKMKKKEDMYFFFLTWETLYENNVLFNFEGKTTGIKNLLFDVALESIKIPLPEFSLTDKFNKITTQFFHRIQKNIQENHRLAALRDWLLPMLMNGQVGFKGDC